MQINMTTFAPRRRQYLGETLRSLFASDWRDTDGSLNLILGSADDAHVKEAACHPRVRIVAWDGEADENLRWNCTLNKIRALRHGDGSPTLFCEDDVIFRPDWYASLHAAIAELKDQRYVLSLFADARVLSTATLVAGTTLIKHYPTPDMQGAQAVYFPTRAIQLEVADYLSEHVTLGCGDDLMGRYARSQAALYSTREILVDHIGAISCFQDDLECDSMPSVSQGRTGTGGMESESLVQRTDVSLELTSVPAYGSFLGLSGRVQPAEPENLGVATYIRVYGGWWTKPNWESPVTLLAQDGSFTVEVVTGGHDELATEIAAFVVPLDYFPPSLRGEPELPAELSLRSFAHVQVTRQP